MILKIPTQTKLLYYSDEKLINLGIESFDFKKSMTKIVPEKKEANTAYQNTITE